MSLIEQIDKNRLPQHVAIIMDGNGRWAKAKGKDRSYGHQEGVVSVRKVVEAATTVGLKYLTMYTFSTENWNRPEAELYCTDFSQYGCYAHIGFKLFGPLGNNRSRETSGQGGGGEKNKPWRYNRGCRLGLFDDQRYSRSGFIDPYRRRTTRQQLPALAVVICRILLYRCVLAGL